MVKQWDVATGQAKATTWRPVQAYSSYGPVAALAFTRDGELLAADCVLRSVFVWNATR